MSYGGNNSGGWGAPAQGGYGAPVQGQGWPDEQPGDKATEVDAASLVIDDGAVIDHDADQSEKNAEERKYFHIEQPGTYRLKVVGFGKTTKELKKCFTQGQPRQFEATQVVVRFGDVRDVRYQITDSFLLPPGNPNDLRDYNYGSTQQDGSTSGFHAEKFGHFINRLVGGFQKGQKLPPAARELRQWLGREIEAEVKIQKAREGDKVDPATGKKVIYQARAQIALYSYRACGTIQPQGAPQGQPQSLMGFQQAPQSQPQGQPQAPQGQPLPRGVANI
jgi:hypothetical protein